MVKSLRLLIAATCCMLITGNAIAQQQFALLVGVNRYFDQPGKVHSSLSGCVNDALSMKKLLINRFGFEEAGISMLLDEQATKDSVISCLLDILKKSHSGDAVVFYFSGHGVWMNNMATPIVNDQVKRGMNQAMVMSNLYAPNMGCLLTDAIIKKIFNRFVDKKVILTSLFDCCFSGSLPMSISMSMHNYYQNPFYGGTEKSISSEKIKLTLKINEGSLFNPEQALLNETFNPENLDSTLYYIDSPVISNNSDSNAFRRSFNLKDAISINDPSMITRPSERPQSNFFSLSATNDVQKGAEVRDASGNYHGAFTIALLDILKTNPADMPLSKITELILQKIKYQQYSQTPTFNYDPGRLNGNLIGIPPNRFKNKFMAACDSVKNGTIILKAGTLDGIAKGNLLSKSNKVIVQVTSTAESMSTAKLIKGRAEQVKPGEMLQLTDAYTVSNPLIRIHIQPGIMEDQAFGNFFTEKVTPLVQLSQYDDYRNYDLDPALIAVMFNDPKKHPEKLAANLLDNKVHNPFLVFLPIPNSITNELTNRLRRNQNIQLVNTPNDADYTLYLNYVKGSNGNKAGFIFTFANFKSGTFMFSKPYRETPEISTNSNKNKMLVTELERLTLEMIRTKTDNWINEFRRK